jgi:predicted acyltransferase
LSQRYYSLDVFRGATVALMILVNNPGSWGHIFPPFAHAPWNGATPTDWVFPFFLFAVGNAMAFALPKLQQQGSTVYWKKILQRTLLIFIIGLTLNWYPFGSFTENGWVFRSWVSKENPESGVRILGVLQRIALCYGIAGLLIFFFKPKALALISAFILLAYWAVAYGLGTPGDPYSLSGFFGTGIDKSILSVAHMYKGEGIPFDPEGLVSTLPAVVQVIIGYLTGLFIIKSGKSYQTLSYLFIAGTLLLLVANGWNYVFPINKKIWTSSYVLYAGGWSVLLLSMLIYYIEFTNKKNFGTEWFSVFGKNPLFIFVLSIVIPKTSGLIRFTYNGEKTTPLHWFYTNVCKNIHTDLRWGSLLYAIVFVMILWAIAYWLNKKKIYIKV